MYVVRPVETTDVGALETLLATSTPGVHTLPRTREKIAALVVSDAQIAEADRIMRQAADAFLAG